MCGYFDVLYIIDINDQLQNLIYQKEITSLTIRSFEKAFQQLDQLLPARLSQIQEYCQSIQELESERINQVYFYYSKQRDLMIFRSILDS